jgi:hypothetical protein
MKSGRIEIRYVGIYGMFPEGMSAIDYRVNFVEHYENVPPVHGPRAIDKDTHLPEHHIDERERSEN